MPPVRALTCTRYRHRTRLPAAILSLCDRRHCRTTPLIYMAICVFDVINNIFFSATSYIAVWHGGARRANSEFPYAYMASSCLLFTRRMPEGDTQRRIAACVGMTPTHHLRHASSVLAHETSRTNTASIRTHAALHTLLAHLSLSGDRYLST